MKAIKKFFTWVLANLDSINYVLFMKVLISDALSLRENYHVAEYIILLSTLISLYLKLGSYRDSYIFSLFAKIKVPPFIVMVAIGVTGLFFIWTNQHSDSYGISWFEYVIGWAL